MNRLTPSRWEVVAVLLIAGSPVPAIQGQHGAQGSIAPPEGNVVLFAFRAEGFQIYECKAKEGAPGAFDWALRAPDALLFDDRGEKAGTHGAGPIWKTNDGSTITGTKIAALDAPGRRAIPSLLLKVESKGTGVFEKVTYIQRVETWAGLPPVVGASKVNLGKTVCVKYEATYRFYGPAEARRGKTDE